MNPIIILELSRLNASNPDDDNKSQWDNHVKEPIEINQGDQISLRNAFINVDEQSSDDIVIPDNGLDITLNFGYYEYNTTLVHRTPQNNYVPGAQNVDYQPYIIYEGGNNSGSLIQLNFDVGLPGLYVGTQYIHLSWTNKDGSSQTTGDEPLSFDASNMNPASNTFTLSVDGAIPNSRFHNVIVDSVKWTNPNDRFYQDILMTAQTPFGTYVGEQASDQHMKQGSTTIKLTGGTYDPQSLSKEISDKLQYLNPELFNGNVEFQSTTDILFRTATEVGKTYYGYPLGSIPAEEKGYQFSDNVPYWVGASQCSIVYGSDAGLGNIFAFEYLHTPFFSPDKKLSVKMYEEGLNNKKYIVPTQSGIFLTSVQPESFFTQELGFNLSDIIMPLSTGTGGIKYIDSITTFDSKITKGYIGIQSLFPSGERQIADTIPAGGTFDAPTTTMLLATERNLDPVGHFLIELTFNSTGQKYIFQDGSLSHVFGILSRQYLNDGFVTGYSDSGVPYQHSGSSFSLQNVRIRILDPITKVPIPNLGENSSIYLQIDKQEQKAIKN